MSQPANWGVPGTAPATPVEYAGRDNGSFDALLSGHIGASRPANAVQGTTWLKDTGSSPLIIEEYKFDGTDDILIASYDVAANTVTFPGAFTNPMTTQGDMIRGGAAGAAERFAIGSAGQKLQSDGTDANWVGDPGKNLIINGDMRIAQRGTSFTPTTEEYTLDRWEYAINSTGAVTVTKDTDVPTGEGFSSSLKVDVTTADASIAAAEYSTLVHKIEGFNFAHLMYGTAAALAATLNFWVKSPKSGIHTIGLVNSALNRSVSYEYTVASADTWERITVALTGDVIGTWIGETNGIGVRVYFNLAVGSDFHATTPGTWEAAAKFSTSNQVNCMDNTANNFFITGIQLEVGDVATDFEHRSIGIELASCQRYAPVFDGEGGANEITTWGQCTSTSQISIYLSFTVEVRTPPTGVTVSNVANMRVSQANGTQTSFTALNFVGADKKGAHLTATGVSGSPLVAGNGSVLQSLNTNTKIEFTGSEL